jgi:hypothetical protein
MRVKDDKIGSFLRAKRQIAMLSSASISIGVHGPEDSKTRGPDGRPARTKPVPGNDPISMAELATIHEFGTDRIPARPFLRPGVDGAIRDLDRVAGVAIGQIMDGDRTAQQTADLMGIVAVGSVHDRIASGIDPALAESTRAKRDKKAESVGYDNGLAGQYTPLRDTGNLIQSITYRARVERTRGSDDR